MVATFHAICFILVCMNYPLSKHKHIWSVSVELGGVQCLWPAETVESVQSLQKSLSSLPGFAVLFDLSLNRLLLLLCVCVVCVYVCEIERDQRLGRAGLVRWSMTVLFQTGPAGTQLFSSKCRSASARWTVTLLWQGFAGIMCHYGEWGWNIVSELFWEVNTSRFCSFSFLLFFF